MKYRYKIWCKQDGDLLDQRMPAYAFVTNVKFELGDRAYGNRRGLVQHRKDSQMPDAYVGRVLSTRGDKETPFGIMVKESQVFTMIREAMIAGKPI